MRDSDFYVLEDGTRLPRVTAILKAAYPFANLKWAADMAMENTLGYVEELLSDTALDPRTVTDIVRDQIKADLKARGSRAGVHDLGGTTSADIGTAVHAYAESVMRIRMGENVKPVVLPNDAPHQNAANAFHAWLDAHDVKPIKTEVRVISRAHGYAGTADLLAIVDGAYTVVDFKTSKGIYIEYPLQLAAYAKAVEEMGTCLVAPDAAVVRFPKEAGDEFQVVYFSPEAQREQLFPMFLNAMKQFEYRQWFNENFPYRWRSKAK